MWQAALLVFNTALLFLILGILAAGARDYFRLKRVVRHIATWLSQSMMECDELIDQMLDGEKSPLVPTAQPPAQLTDHATPPRTGGAQRARLAAVAVVGQAREYLGKQVTAAEVEEMPGGEIAKLYQRYEARLGATMTKTLGSSMLQMYALAAGTVLPIPPESQAGLVEDLESDPFLGHALTTVCCKLYHRYGMYLAPLTVVLTTAKHCRFENLQHVGQSNGESSRDPSSGRDRGHEHAATESDCRREHAIRVSEPRESDCTSEGP